MKIIFLVGDRNVAFSAGFSSRFAGLEVRRVCVDGHIEIAVLTIFRFLITFRLVSFVVTGREGEFAVWAVFLFMVLFIVLLLEVDIEHFVANGASFNVTSAISEMSGALALREFFKTVLTSL
jgi:hypothetical protein